MYQFQKDPFCLIILYNILFYFLHIYKEPNGQGETTIGDNFLWKQKGLIALITGCMLQKYLCCLILCTFFQEFVYVYSPSRGRQPIDVNRKDSFGHLLQDLKKSLQPLILYTSFHDIAVGQGQTNPRGQNFYVNRNLLSLQPFSTSFKKSH